MDERISIMTDEQTAETKTPRTPQEIVTEGVNRFALAESHIRQVALQLYAIGGLYIEAAGINAADQFDAIRERDELWQLAGRIMGLHADIMDRHRAGTAMAKKADADVPGRYIETPLAPGVPETKSGDR